VSIADRFQPIGERARWRILVDEFAAVDRGTTISYDQMAEVLDLDPLEDRKAISAAVRSASRVLSSEHERSLVPVRNVGYRVALPDEHVELAGEQQRRSRKALVRARNHVEHVDLSGLSDEGKRIVHAAASALAWQHAQIQRLDLRQKDLERVLDSVTAKVEGDHETRLAELEAQIAAKFG
jgi:hypothetical protein